MGIERNKDKIRRVIDEFMNNSDATVIEEVWAEDIKRLGSN